VVDPEVLVQTAAQRLEGVIPLLQARHYDVRRERRAAPREGPYVQVVHRKHPIYACHLAADGLHRQAVRNAFHQRVHTLARQAQRRSGDQEADHA
jgi:hypothetical protein